MSESNVQVVALLLVALSWQGTALAGAAPAGAAAPAPPPPAEVKAPVKKLELSPEEARALLAAWPAFTSAELHHNLSQRLEAGHVRRLDVMVDLPAEDHARLLTGVPMPAEGVPLDPIAGTQPLPVVFGVQYTVGVPVQPPDVAL